MRMEHEIHAVLFDLDGTLLDRRRSFELFVRKQRERFVSSLGAIHSDRYVQTLVRLDRDGYGPREELFTGLVSEFDLPPPLATDLLVDYRAGFPSACVLFPDVAHTLSALRSAGLRLGLITNGSVSMQSRKLECLSLSSSFDTILISAAEGISKPDPEIFRRALERLVGPSYRATARSWLDPCLQYTRPSQPPWPGARTCPRIAGKPPPSLCGLRAAPKSRSDTSRFRAR